MVISLLCAVLTGLQLPPEAAPAQGKQPPATFAAGTAQVLVDFVVTGKNGRVVPNLTEKDFKVSEDGKERKIVSFLAFGGSDPSTPDAPGEPEPSLSTTQLARTITVLFVDDARLTPAQAFHLRPALKA
jgi:hypothetical protein